MPISKQELLEQIRAGRFNAKMLADYDGSDLNAEEMRVVLQQVRKTESQTFGLPEEEKNALSDFKSKASLLQTGKEALVYDDQKLKDLEAAYGTLGADGKYTISQPELEKAFKANSPLLMRLFEGKTSTDTVSMKDLGVLQTASKDGAIVLTKEAQTYLAELIKSREVYTTPPNLTKKPTNDSLTPIATLERQTLTDGNFPLPSGIKLPSEFDSRGVTNEEAQKVFARRERDAQRAIQEETAKLLKEEVEKEKRRVGLEKAIQDNSTTGLQTELGKTKKELGEIDTALRSVDGVVQTVPTPLNIDTATRPQINRAGGNLKDDVPLPSEIHDDTKTDEQKAKLAAKKADAAKKATDAIKPEVKKMRTAQETLAEEKEKLQAALELAPEDKDLKAQLAAKQKDVAQTQANIAAFGAIAPKMDRLTRENFSKITREELKELGIDLPQSDATGKAIVLPSEVDVAKLKASGQTEAQVVAEAESNSRFAIQTEVKKLITERQQLDFRQEFLGTQLKRDPHNEGFLKQKAETDARLKKIHKTLEDVKEVVPESAVNNDLPGKIEPISINTVTRKQLKALEIAPKAEGVLPTEFADKRKPDTPNEQWLEFGKKQTELAKEGIQEKIDVLRKEHKEKTLAYKALLATPNPDAEKMSEIEQRLIRINATLEAVKGAGFETAPEKIGTKDKVDALLEASKDRKNKLPEDLLKELTAIQADKMDKRLTKEQYTKIKGRLEAAIKVEDEKVNEDGDSITNKDRVAELTLLHSKLGTAFGEKKDLAASLKAMDDDQLFTHLKSKTAEQRFEIAQMLQDEISAGKTREEIGRYDHQLKRIKKLFRDIPVSDTATAFREMNNPPSASNPNKELDADELEKGIAAAKDNKKSALAMLDGKEGISSRDLELLEAAGTRKSKNPAFALSETAQDDLKEAIAQFKESERKAREAAERTQQEIALRNQDIKAQNWKNASLGKWHEIAGSPIGDEGTRRMQTAATQVIGEYNRKGTPIPNELDYNRDGVLDFKDIKAVKEHASRMYKDDGYKFVLPPQAPLIPTATPTTPDAQGVNGDKVR